MEGGKIKNIKKQTLLEFLAIVLLLVTFCFIFFKEAYGANPDGYNSSGYCYLHVGTNTTTVNVAFNEKDENSDFYNNGSHRSDFFKASHKIKVTLSGTNGDIKLVKDGENVNSANYMTVKDSKGKFNTLFLKVRCKVPAHYYFKGTSKTDDGDGAFSFVSEAKVSDKNRYEFPGSFGHSTQDHWETVWVRLNLSNTHMLVDDQATWHHATLIVGSNINSYTFTYYTNGGIIKDLNEGTNSNGNVVYSRSCGSGLGRAPLVERPGYDFDGWYYSDGKKLQTGADPRWPTTAINLCYASGGDQSVTALWKAQSHYVTFDTQGGTFPSSLKSQTELDGCKIIPNGIYSIKSNCGSNMYIHVYGAGYNQTPDNTPAICIYGGKGGSQTQWVVERYGNTQYYTITSYHNGLALSLAGAPTNNSPGTGQQGRQLELWSMEKDIIDYQWYFKENNGHLEIYNRSTNQCLDVYDAGTADGTKIWQYNPNHSYAQWWDFEPVVQTDYPFKLQYANYNLLTPSISPQRGSDKFLGWSTDKNATSPTYKANSICNIYGNSNVTLYAIYQARATVSYDANGGSNASLPKPKVVDVGSKITLASAGSMGRDNYVFLGWSTDPHAAKNYNAADSEVTVNSSGNVVYYAIWKNATGNADLSNVITGDGMFTNDTELEGQNGTTYNSIHDGLDYAKPDGGVDDPGYYIEK